MTDFMYLRKWLCLLLLAITLQGCSGCANGYEYMRTYNEIRGGGIVSDTTVVFLEVVIELWEYEGAFGSGGGNEHRLRELNLNLADIRFEKIYWSKKITPADNYGHLGFYIIDSTLFFYTKKCVSYYNEKDCKIDRIAVVNMDDKFHRSEKIELKYSEIELEGEGWEYRDNEKVRPWKDGLILAYRDGACALLDTAVGTMKLWQPSGEFEWLHECDDFKWSSVGGLCLKRQPDTLGFVLLRNGIDTLAVRYANKPPVEYDRVSLHFAGNAINFGGWIYLINKLGQISEKPLEAWGSVGRFFDLYGNLLVDYRKDTRF